MADYTEIKGNRIQYLDSDPTLTSANEGQVWYNTATGTLKGLVKFSAWSSGPPTNSQHGDGSGCGEQTATVIWGGYSPDNPQITNSTEEYNGSGWTTGGNYPATTIGSGSAGVLTAALGISGRLGPSSNTNAVNNYDGSTWTATTNYPASNYGTIGFGSQTAAVGLGGNPRADAAPSGVVNSTFDWNGSAWTSSGNYPSTISNAGGTGSQTAGITAGGYDNTGTNQTFSAEYNGSTWTTGPNINRPADSNMAQAGNQTSSLIYGGGANAVKTESWDGVAWSNQPDLAGIGGYGGQMGATNNSSGSSKGLLAATREGSNYPVATEEYNVSINTVTPAAWSSGGNTNDSRRALGSVGSQTAGLAFGGRLSPAASPPAGFVAKTEQYDGTSWTEVNDLNNARSNVGGAGTQTAAVAFGGLNPGLGPRPAGNTETWDGTNWTNGTASPTVAENYGACGTLTAALKYGGDNSPVGVTNSTLEFDGTNFTTGGNMNTARNLIQGSAGSQTAGLAFGGTGPNNQTEEYNGSTWTSVNNLNNSNFYNSSASSPQTDALGFGSNHSSPVASVEQYNGTSWFTAPNLGTQRSDGTGFGTTANGSVMVNGPSGPTTYPSATEEFTGETSAATASTLTTS